MANKYYVVIHGHERGIFNDFSSAEKMINNYPSAIFRSFYTLSEAEKYLQFISLNKLPVKSSKLPLLPRLSIPSLFFSSSPTGFGIIITKSDGNIINVYGKIPNDTVSHLIYTFYVTLSLVTGNIFIITDSDQNKNILQNYIHNIHTTNSKLNQAIIPLLNGRNIKFHTHPISPNLSQLVELGSASDKDLIVVP